MTFSPLWFAALPGLLALGIWSVTQLERFLLLAVLGTMIIPNALVTPGGAQVALSDVLLVILLAGWLVARAAGVATWHPIADNRLLPALLLFVAVNAESLMWSEDPRATIQFTIQLVELVLIIPIVFAALPRSVDEIKRGMYLFILASCVLGGVYTAFHVGDSLPGGIGKNTAGTFIAAGLVMAYALSLCEPRAGKRRLLELAVLVEFGGLLVTASRGSLIGALVGLIVLSFLLERRRVLVTFLVAAGALGFLAVHGTSSGANLEIAGAYDTSEVRKYSFDQAIDKIQERPFLGTGAGTYSDVIAEFELALPDPNNLFLLTWAEIGIPGMLALLLLLQRSARLLVMTRRLPSPYREVAAGAGGVALSLLIHFQVDVSWTRGTTALLYAMLGLLVALDRLGAPLDEPVAVPTRSRRRLSLTAAT